MAQFPPERLILHDERVKALMFAVLGSDVDDTFGFDGMLETWFSGQEPPLAGFLEWLDLHGLEIRKKQ